MRRLPPFPKRYAWLDDYLRAKPGCVREYKVSWDATLYRLQGKIFGLHLVDGGGRAMLNLKCEPFLALEYRASFPGVIAGWHMNKLHWNSILLAGDTPDEVCRELADISYELVLYSLPKRLRAVIGAVGPEREPASG